MSDVPARVGAIGLSLGLRAAVRIGRVRLSDGWENTAGLCYAGAWRMQILFIFGFIPLTR
ncbi:hypothetical protein [Acetobacter papayae]|uniref:hypothetical protein n=1 Tax=Acetobacter papayae TaxID=1076592 RepID=UPI0011DCD150|nr:hypothetical protein [Acetobacter papayae]